MTEQRRFSPWAIASLVCGVLGLAIGVSSILAVVFGHIARKEFARIPPGDYDSVMATAGLILGYVVIAIMAIGFVVFGGLMGGALFTLFSL